MDRTDSRRYLLMALLILAISLAPRLYQIASPATYHLHPIRQYQSAMTARDFYERSMNLLDPRLEVGIHASAPPSPVALEIQIMPWIAALLYRVTGVHEWLGNLLGLGFYVGAGTFLYLLARRFVRPEFALVAVAFYSFTPESFKYSRTFMPDFEVLFFSLGALYFIDRYLADSKRRDWAWATAFLALAFLTKINYLYIAGVVAAMAVARDSWRAFARWDLWLLGAVSLAPSVAYYPYSRHLAEGAHNYVGEMIGGRILPYIASNLVSADFYYVIARGSSAMLTIMGLVLLAPGVVWAARGMRDGDDARYRRVFLLAWVAMTFVYLVVMGRDLLRPHNYYFLPVLPVGAILVAGLTQWFADRIPVLAARARVIGYAAVALSVAAAAVLFVPLRGYYASIEPEVATYLAAADELAANTSPDDRIVYLTEDTGWTYFVLYHSHRLGWHFWQPNTRVKMEQELETWRGIGADYLYVMRPEEYRYLPAGAWDTGFEASLTTRFGQVGDTKVGTLYDLTE